VADLALKSDGLPHCLNQKTALHMISCVAKNSARRFRAGQMTRKNLRDKIYDLRFNNKKES